jgi:hypothetical protein
MQYAAGEHRPTDLENIISDCLQYTTISSSPSKTNYKSKYKYNSPNMDWKICNKAESIVKT